MGDLSTKTEIKKKVIAKLNKFCGDKFEEIEFLTEGSLTETYKYMSLNNVKSILETCFEETYTEVRKY